MSEDKTTMPKSTGMKRTASASATSRSSAGSSHRPPRYPYFALCLCNDGAAASLEVGKAYRVVRPDPKDPAYNVRVVDEDREDYLYPAEWFMPLELPPRAKKALTAAAG